jgi:cell division protein FtsQ
MDGGGRFAQPLTSLVSLRRDGAAQRSHSFQDRSPRSAALGAFERRLEAIAEAIVALNVPRGAGLAASILIVGASIAFGIARGDHVSEIADDLDAVRDLLGNSLGMHIDAVAVTGQRRLSREDVLASAGVTERTSLLFFDVAGARARLEHNPWIAEASAQTLYPDQLQIAITEREAFALWQHDARVFVIAADGTVLETYNGSHFTNLPLIVGAGAAARAKDFLVMLDRYPEIRDDVRAAVLIAERRWNLVLKSGIDVRLPETDIVGALTELAELTRSAKLLSRDIDAVDLRLPDRVIVQLSDAAAAAREEAIKAKKPKVKGGAV